MSLDSTKQISSPSQPTIATTPAPGSEPPPGDRVSQHPALLALIGVLAGSLLTLAGLYFVTYELIERPKIELEQKKAEIEAVKQAQSLTPNVTHTCDPTPIDAWSWKLSCRTHNAGQFTTEISISEILVSVLSDPKEPQYTEGQGFTVTYPNNKKLYWLPPASDGLLRAYIQFDKTRYPNGIQRTDLEARVGFTHKTVKPVQDFILNKFPSLTELVESTASGGISMRAQLPKMPASE